MALQHARTPSLLGDSDYGEFCDLLTEFLSDDRSQPNRPTQWVAEQAARAAAFKSALDAMNIARNAQKTASDAIKNTVKAMVEKLRWMRAILPTLSDESILLPFGLDREIPVTYAEIKDYADAVDAHWQTVRTDPLFAPVQTLMDELAGMISAYETERAQQETLAGEYSQRQNEKDDAREAHHGVERKIFNWYRSFYPDGEDSFWEQTPWGTTSGGGTPGEELEPPGNYIYDPEKTEFSWDSVVGATGYEAEISPDGNSWENIYGGADTSFVKGDLTQGGWYSRVRATAGSIRSDWSEIIEINIAFAPPTLHYKAVARLLWCNPIMGATKYQFECDDPAMGIVQTGPNPTYNVPTPQPDDWNFRARAGNEEGQWGEWSEWLLVPVV